MKSYIVGGHVRDLLLGKISRDRDFLVTDSTFEEMLANKFIPVGKSHQVFLHPQTREEYTLARDLYHDLSRRDITINALALSGEKVIDYFGGLKDLKNKVIRHIREENFYQDPLRVYRVARLWAQLPDFSIHPDTLRLMQLVSMTQEFQSISGERIMAELEKALSSDRPELFLETIRIIGALSKHFPQLAGLSINAWKETLTALKCVSKETNDVVIRYASLYIEVSEEKARPFPVPGLWQEAREGVKKFYRKAIYLYQYSAKEIVDMFYALDSFRKPYMEQVIFFILKGTGHRFPAIFFDECFEICRAVTSQDVYGVEGPEIGRLIRKERERRLSQRLPNYQEARYEREA